MSLPLLHGAFAHQSHHHVPVHQHSHHELILVCGGDVTTHLNGHNHSGVPGMLHVVPAHAPHDQQSHLPNWSTICFLCSNIEPWLSVQPRTIDCRSDSVLENWANDLVHCHRDGGDQTMLNALLLTCLRRIHSHEGIPSPQRDLPLQRACAFMTEHLDTNFTNEAVAEAAGLSVSHLGACFRSAFQCGPLRWAQQQRLERAARLLADPYTSISSIAHACGYTDVTHFIRHFRRKYACTPGHFRRKQ